jgi:hypothetical protein
MGKIGTVDVQFRRETVMRRDLSPSFNPTRRHLVIGAIGAAVLPVATRAVARAIDTPATEQDVAFMRLALEEAKERGVKFGRKRELTAERVEEIRTLRGSGETVPAIIERTKLSKASVYRALA